MATVKIGNKEHTINEELAVGDRFRLMSCDEVFTVVEVYLAAGFIPSVVGRNSRHQTCTRIVDTLEV